MFRNEIIFLIKESVEGGVPAKALGVSIITEANDLASLKKAIRDVVICHFEEGKTPKIIRLHYIKEEIMAA